MADSLILNHAARVLNLITPQVHADLALRQYLATAKRLGPREKRAVSQAVFTYFRWRNWTDLKASAQKQVEEAIEVHQRFEKNPSSIKTEALAARAVPVWLPTEAVLPPETLRQLQKEPLLWLRARPGKSTELSQALDRCEPASRDLLARLGVPEQHVTALAYRGAKDLFLTPQFHNGEFEIQDLASQLVGHACSPNPGETWWDACAGEGGKTLHLADLMGNKGLIWATDRSERRLQSLKRRTARAKIFNYRAAVWDGGAKLPTKTLFDGVLVDAPCSGVGTWQRNPHARWTTTPQDVKELAAIQRDILEHVAKSIKPGGRLVYSVCTLTRSETADVANAFTAAHPDFEAVNVFANPPTPASQVSLWPHELNANGMFIATWRKKK
jgi:16S rRNA (cytosine967-C5)-methyltransferase